MGSPHNADISSFHVIYNTIHDYGLDVIPDTYQPNVTEPEENQVLWSASMASHVLAEFHTASEEDWNNFFTYRDTYQK